MEDKYEDYPHITEKDVKKLLKLDEKLKNDKRLIDFSRKKGIDEIGLKAIVIRNTYKKRKILGNITNIHLSGVPRETWKQFGEKVKNRSAKIVELIEDFLLKNKY